jgi:AcrR family transcriptional regulator
VAAKPKRRRTAPSEELGPLPGGHHGLSREQILESQRERLLAGFAHAVAERGYRATTIADVVRAASVSSKAFYQSFASKEDCFLATFDAVLAHLRGLIATAVESDPDWPAKMVAALRATTRFFASEPDLARLVLIEPITASPRIATHFRAAVLSGVPYLREGRGERPAAAALPESTEDLLLGGLVVLLARAVLAGDDTSLEDRLPDLVDFALAPYLGAARAKQLAAASA